MTKIVKKAIMAVIAVLAVFVFVTILTACSKANVNTLVYHGKRFQLVEKYDDCLIVVDTETGVKYACGRYDARMTVLLDSYGNPLLYSAYDAREDRA